MTTTRRTWPLTKMTFTDGYDRFTYYFINPENNPSATFNAYCQLTYCNGEWSYYKLAIQFKSLNAVLNFEQALLNRQILDAAKGLNHTALIYENTCEVPLDASALASFIVKENITKQAIFSALIRKQGQDCHCSLRFDNHYQEKIDAKEEVGPSCKAFYAVSFFVTDAYRSGRQISYNETLGFQEKKQAELFLAGLSQSNLSMLFDALESAILPRVDFDAIQNVFLELNSKKLTVPSLDNKSTGTALRQKMPHSAPPRYLKLFSKSANLTPPKPPVAAKITEHLKQYKLGKPA